MSSRRRKMARGGRPCTKRSTREISQAPVSEWLSTPEGYGEWLLDGRDHGDWYREYMNRFEQSDDDFVFREYLHHQLRMNQSSVLGADAYRGHVLSKEPTESEVASHIVDYVSSQGYGCRPVDLQVRRNFEVRCEMQFNTLSLDVEKLTKELKIIYQLPVVECVEIDRDDQSVVLKTTLMTRGQSELLERVQVEPLPPRPDPLALHWS